MTLKNPHLPPPPLFPAIIMDWPDLRKARRAEEWDGRSSSWWTYGITQKRICGKLSNAPQSDGARKSISSL